MRQALAAPLALLIALTMTSPASARADLAHEPAATPTRPRPACEQSSVCSEDVVIQVGGVRVRDPASALAALGVASGSTEVLVLRGEQVLPVLWNAGPL